MISLRSGRVVKYVPRVTKGFNVRGRAPKASAQNIVVTTNSAIASLARKHSIGVIGPESGKLAQLSNAYYYEKLLDYCARNDRPAKKYLLLEAGHNYLYYGVAPLALCGPRSVSYTHLTLPTILLV